MRQWVVALLMTSLAFAGCISDDSEPTDCPDGWNVKDDGSCGPGDSGTDSGDGSGTPDADDGPGDEDAPADDGNDTASIGAGAYISADIESGEAPMTVNFTFGVTEIPQDEFLTWTLDTNADGVVDTEGNGNNLEGNFSYSYATAGEYNATFEATDGFDSWNATIMITVAEPVQTGPVDDGPEPEAGGPYPVTLTLSVAQAHPTFFISGANSCVAWLSGQNGLDCDWAEIDEAWIGKSFTTTGTGDVDVAFASACGPTAEGTGSVGDAGHDSGSIPAGTGCFIAADFTGSGDIVVIIG